MSAGLLILRVVLGLVLAAHGSQNLTHHLGGDGLAGSIKEFADEGFRGGPLTALAAGGTQIGAGSLMVIGLLTPIASAGTSASCWWPPAPSSATVPGRSTTAMSTRYCWPS